MGPDDTYELQKSIWTEADFEQMGWHDVRVHAIAFEPESYRIVFDIDYIFAWVNPPSGETYFSFWIAPATLVFENIADLKIDLESENVEILHIDREDAGKPVNADFIGKMHQWAWTLETTAGEILFKSVGYTQYARQMPRHVRGQSLSLDDRSGVNFAKVGVAM